MCFFMNKTYVINYEFAGCILLLKEKKIQKDIQGLDKALSK